MIHGGKEKRLRFGGQCGHLEVALETGLEQYPAAFRAAMYLRFQTKSPDPRSGHPTGILVAAHELRDSGKLGRDEEQWLRDSLSYFNMHLKVPSCLKDPKHRRGVSWFRSHSRMVHRIRDLVAFMENQGIFIDMLHTDDPGIIYYEDGHQVVAKKRPAGTRGGRPQDIPPADLPSFLTRKHLTRKQDRRIKEP